MEVYSLTVFNRNIQILCQEAEAQALIEANFGHLKGRPESIDLNYTVGKHKQAAVFFIKREEQRPLFAADSGKFLYLFERDMTVELQKLRHDLYFVHAAVVEFAGNAVMFVGESGNGKSTLTWALLHHGFRYLSDELGPVDPESLQVYPYAHALGLKNAPPDSYPLPEKTLVTPRTFIVPVEAFSGGVCNDPAPLAAIFFVRYCRDATGPSVRSISSAEAGARFFANALNPLAHCEAGLDGAIKIATNNACFELLISDLPSTCALVKTTLERHFRTQEREVLPSERKSRTLLDIEPGPGTRPPSPTGAV